VKQGIEIKVIWLDPDLLEVSFSCSNGYFSGQAEIYLTDDKLSEMAESLSGFPSQPKDSRDFEIGTFNPNHADGGVRMHLRCADSVGHAFVSQVRQMNREVGATAFLQMANRVSLKTPCPFWAG
jgi:hypothetical protein